MARLFNLVVFDGTISGGGANPTYFYSSQEHAALLGSVEKMQVQIICRGSTTFTNTIDVDYQLTNAPEYETWATGQNGSLAVTSVTDIPAVTFFQVDTVQSVAAYGRFRVRCSGDMAQVQVVVAGYTKS